MKIQKNLHQDPLNTSEQKSKIMAYTIHDPIIIINNHEIYSIIPFEDPEKESLKYIHQKSIKSQWWSAVHAARCAPRTTRNAQRATQVAGAWALLLLLAIFAINPVGDLAHLACPDGKR